TLVYPLDSIRLQPRFTPTSAGVKTANGTGTVFAGDHFCAPLPPNISLRGVGSTGSVLYSPSSLAFGPIDCGTRAKPQTITFSNSGGTPYTLTPVLARGNASPYVVTMTPSSGIVVARSGGVDGTAVITITPAAIPTTSAVPGNYDDVLTVTTTAS